MEFVNRGSCAFQHVMLCVVHVWQLQVCIYIMDLHRWCFADGLCGFDSTVAIHAFSIVTQRVTP